MMNQAQVYKLFGEIDRLPGIMEPRIGRWCAWPMAKMQLVWHFIYAPQKIEAARSASWPRKLTERFSRYAGALPFVWQHANPGTSSGAIGMLHVPRIHRFGNGRDRDFIFGELLTGAGLDRPVVSLRHPPVGYRSSAVHGTSTIDLAPYHAISEQLALLLMFDSRLRRAGAHLNRLLDRFEIPIDRRVRGRKMLLALALFEARRRVFRRLYAQLGLAALVVSYAPGRYGEIAAARELGLPVVELQHGAFGTHCPDYAWPSDIRPCRENMPLPDRIAVFGQMFRKLILTSGFWKSSEVVATGAAAMEACRSDSSHYDRRPGGPLRLIFMTQPTVRTAASVFWRELLALPGFPASGCQVAFKVHPEEAHHIDVYRNLVNEAPERFRLLAENVNPIEAMLDADIALSYNSMALIEALGIGRAAISLCGGSIPDGFAGSFGLPDIIGVMPHVASSAALLEVLVECTGNEGKLIEWHRKIRSVGKDLFSDGFSANTAALINDLLNQEQRGAVAPAWTNHSPAGSAELAN